MTKDDLLALAERCGMTVYDLNTNVVRSDDGNARLATSGGDPVWGDHVRVEWMPEATPGQWFYAHFSADKAELFARQLLRRAKSLRARANQEPNNG